jgi:hypothetical protein
MTEKVRYRHRSLSRRLATLTSPAGLVAGQLAGERGVVLRRERLIDAAEDKITQRRRPTRPRMRALITSGDAKLAWRAVAAPPPPGPKGALARPIAVATCDLDRSFALGATPFPLPLNIGHECVAEVISVGADVTEVRPGQDDPHRLTRESAREAQRILSFGTRRFTVLGAPTHGRGRGDQEEMGASSSMGLRISWRYRMMP